MELEIVPNEQLDLSPSDGVSNLEENKFSDNDRNHKHRRREILSDFSETDVLDPVFSRPIRQQNRSCDNGHAFRESVSQFERSSPGISTFATKPLDINKRIGFQSFLRDSSPCDFRLSSVNATSQMVYQGIYPGSLFSRNGLPSCANGQNASWNSFGCPGVPNGGSNGLQGLGASVNDPFNMGFPRQQCRDFEERGFCLRGDMCLMEHSVNRIVVKDVQSLSHFNLPASLPTAQLLEKPAGSDGASEADFYDPDQPLWNNGRSEASSAFLELNSSKIEESDYLLDGNSCDTTDNGVARVSYSLSASAWRRICSSRRSSEVKEGDNSTVNLSHQHAGDLKEDREVVSNGQNYAYQGKTHNNRVRSTLKSSQKALCTLFVKGIPQKNNRINSIESLLFHFKKFGEIVDVYIPLDSEQAFVQFSRKEEAEAALKAPDAVMGNRFIKLFWANRDTIPDLATNCGNFVSTKTNGKAATTVPPQLHVPGLGKEKARSVPHSVSIKVTCDVPVIVGNSPKRVIKIDPTSPPALQKKLENLELLKEELRKKQELLDQKRTDFKHQLKKMEKHTSGLKGDEVSDQPLKRHKAEIILDDAKATAPSDSGTAMTSPVAERIPDNNKSVDNAASRCFNSTSTMVLLKHTSLKHPIRPLASVMTHFLMNRFNLDNRPTTFKIIPPFPLALANVAILKEHFSSYNDLSNVELVHQETHDDSNGLDSLTTGSARVTFTSHSSAENAFVNGTCFQGYNLKFAWLTSINSINGGKENSVSALQEPTDANVHLENNNPTPVIFFEQLVSEKGKFVNSQRNKSCVNVDSGKDF